jgi:hypothetical protein
MELFESKSKEETEAAAGKGQGEKRIAERSRICFAGRSL